MDPHKVPCVESSAPVPWSEESISKLLSILLLRSSAAPPNGGGGGGGGRGRGGGHSHSPSEDRSEGKPPPSHPPSPGGRRMSMGQGQGSDGPTRLEVLLSLYETASHIRELWGEVPLNATVRKAQADKGPPPKSLSRRTSSAMLSTGSARPFMTEAEILSK
jgi:hypothetical protein